MKKAFLLTALLLTACVEIPQTWDTYYAEEMYLLGWELKDEKIYKHGVAVYDREATCPGRYGSTQCTDYIGPPGFAEELGERYKRDLELAIKIKQDADRKLLNLD